MPDLARHLLVNTDMTGAAYVDEPQLAALTERHPMMMDVPIPSAGRDPRRLILEGTDFAGVIFVRESGWESRLWINVARSLLDRGVRVYHYFPRERAIEVVDRERLRSLWALWIAQKGFGKLSGMTASLRRPDEAEGTAEDRDGDAWYFATKTRLNALPVPFPPGTLPPTPERPMPGTGVYLRFDYWANIGTGGSYGHTCYVAKELARRTEQFLVVNANRYAMLDAMGIEQLIPEPPGRSGDEELIARGGRHFYRNLKELVAYLKPAYLYERLVIGNAAGARLSQELGIPYLVEYNGSEISIKRSFGDGKGYKYDELYLEAEMAAFRQATLIVAISAIVKDELVLRGVDEAKILVNPNGADCDDYAPLPPEEKRALRRELGYADDEVVCGFIGTFGGWHGIDVLAESLPLVAARAPQVRWLLVGDGMNRSLVDDAVARHGLEEKVRLPGALPNGEGRRLLQACDILVSPHSRHMTDSRFFGSPTKLFEYMALGAAIVGSDLEQIGEVLSPALTAGQVPRDDAAGEARAVLCAPGDTQDFVDAVVELARRPDLVARLGANARRAAVDVYSWSKNVERIFAWLTERGERERSRSETARTVAAGDAFKERTQNQWDHDPCGSHYVKGAARHTLAWYRKAEEYRFGVYAPWMPRDMEFDAFAGKRVLEVGGGMGTDLAQFARHGADVTDIDLSSEHLEMARENLALRGLGGTFIHHDAESLPFEDATFDLVYSNGVLHHTPNTDRVIGEIHRVLKPGGRVIAMFYAENSIHYWSQIVYQFGLMRRGFDDRSVGEIMSEVVELSDTAAKPRVKVYTAARLRAMFSRFGNVDVLKRQLTREELHPFFRWMPLGVGMRLMGWNLVIKGEKRAP